jgi:Spy/CpxP family protein refolding chaperone
MHGPPIGIPPPVAAKLGLSPEVTKAVRDASLDANEALIGLEADLKRAQLDLERTLTDAKPDEAKVMLKLDVISKAELAVRKNRVGLMLKVRKLLGPEAWEKLQAEFPMHGGPGGPGRGPPPTAP